MMGRCCLFLSLITVILYHDPGDNTVWSPHGCTSYCRLAPVTLFLFVISSCPRTDQRDRRSRNSHSQQAKQKKQKRDEEAKKAKLESTTVRMATKPFTFDTEGNILWVELPNVTKLPKVSTELP